MLLTLERSHIQLDIGIHLVEVGHWSRLVTFESEVFDYCFFDFSLDLCSFGNCWALLCCQSEPLLNITLIVASDGIDGSLPALLLVILDICQRLLIHVLWHGSSFDLSLDLLRRWDHLGLGFRQVEWVELRAFRLLLFFAAIR